VLERARTFARNLARQVDERGRDALMRLSFAEKIERGARTEHSLAVTSDQMDANQFLLATPLGTVDLQTGLLRASDPADLLTKVTAVAPSERSDCPRFRKFMDEATRGDQELIRFLQQFCGYSLTGSIREQALAFICGPGGNGKGVFANVIGGILKDHAKVAPMEALTASNAVRHETELAMLRGARLVTASETEAGKSWAEARVKQLTGGDPITARFMHRDHFTFKPTFKLLVIGNHKPALRNVDNANRRRMNIVEFPHIPAEPDLVLEAKLKGEWPAILRWMIEGCLDWQDAGLIRPKSVIKASADYLASQDTFGAAFSEWIAEACDVGPSLRETGAALRESWESHANKAGEPVGNPNRFSEAMQKRGFEVKRGTGGTRLYLGIALKHTIST
jgi:putative DNA primase/helicase